jgi:hypothetical protein
MSVWCPSCGRTWDVIPINPQLTNPNRCVCGYLFQKPTTLDPVNHPPHYTSGPIECFDAMKSAFTKEEMIAYCKVAAFKYLWREGKKDSQIQERKKAVWYLQKSIELMESSLAQEETK